MAWNTVGTVGGAPSSAGSSSFRWLGLRATLTLAAAATADRRDPRPSAASGTASGRRAGSPAAAAALTVALLLPAWPQRPSGAGAGFYAGQLRNGGGASPGRARDGDPLLQGRDRHDALGRPAGGLPLLSLQRKDRRLDRTGRHGQPAPPGTPADAGPPGPAGRLRAGPRHGGLRGRDRPVPGRSIEIADIEAAGPRGHAVLRAGEPERPRGPPRPLPRGRRPQRPPRAQGHLRRDPLGPLGRVGRGRGQPLHAGVLRAGAPAPEAGRRHGAVVPHALAAAGSHEAHRRDVSLAFSRTPRTGARTGAT